MGQRSVHSPSDADELGAARAQVLACALLQDLGAAPDGPRCGELAAFCVSPAYRGSGRGDALLDYVEQSARDQGMRRLVLLTTRTADWCAFSAAAGRRMKCVPHQEAKQWLREQVSAAGF